MSLVSLVSLELIDLKDSKVPKYLKDPKDLKDQKVLNNKMTYLHHKTGISLPPKGRHCGPKNDEVRPTILSRAERAYPFQ